MNETNPHPHPDPDRIQAYFDQALDPGAARAVQDHLQQCPSCRSALERLEDLSFQLSSLPEIALTRDLSADVLTSLRTHRRLSPGIGWTLALEALAAGILIGVLLPVIRAAAWLAGLAGAPRELLTRGSSVLTQLASSWIIWWAQLRLSLVNLQGSGWMPESLSAALPSPWILILAGSLAAALVNFLLLHRMPIKNKTRQA